MKKMQEIIDRGQHVVLEDFKILDVAALLKAYCRALPDSLIPQTSWHYLENLKCMKDTAGEYDEESGWKDVETLQRIFKMVAAPFFFSFSFILLLLILFREFHRRTW